MRRVRFSNRGGFSLLEVILALGVFVVAGVGLMTALNSLAKASTESVDESRVTGQLRTLLTEVSRQPFLQPDETVTDPDPYGISYRILVEPAEFTTAKGEELEDMFRIEITAFRRRGGRDEVIEVAETLRYGQSNR